jgi:hypothetical protein
MEKYKHNTFQILRDSEGNEVKKWSIIKNIKEDEIFIDDYYIIITDDGVCQSIKNPNFFINFRNLKNNGGKIISKGYLKTYTNKKKYVGTKSYRQRTSRNYFSRGY